MASQAIAPAGGSLPHNNMMPYLTLISASRCRESSRREPDFGPREL